MRKPNLLRNLLKKRKNGRLNDDITFFDMTLYGRL